MPLTSQRKAASRCVVAVTLTLVIGTVGFCVIERWSVWRSLFFTLVTITTVGYGDEGMSEIGERFAAVLLLCGIATFTFSLSTLVQIAVNYRAEWIRKMQKKIDSLSNHIVVCGYGRMGKSVCEQLVEGGLQCVVIEHDAANYQTAIDDGRFAIQGSASDDEILGKAGVVRARGVVCAVDSDAENVFITVSVRELNKGAVIASRAEADGAARKLQCAGATLVVSPPQMAGDSIATAFLRPHLAQIMNQRGSGDDTFVLGEVRIEAGSKLEGRTVAEYGREQPGVVFVAVKDPDNQLRLRPTGSETFDAGEVVIVAGLNRDLRHMTQAARRRGARLGV